MNKSQTISNLISFILMLGAAVLVIYCLATQKGISEYGTYLISSVLILLALFCGIVYSAMGSTKSVGLLLRCFECLTGAAMLASIGRMASIGASPISIVLTALSFGLLCILCVAENLGKKRSYCLGAILAALEVVNLIMALSGTIQFAEISNGIARLIIIVILVLLLTHKYYDKDSRGRA